MILQRSIFGTDDFIGSTETAEVSRILEKYPAAANDRWMLYWYVMKDRIAWISQMPEEKQIELKKFCRSLESIRRRAQEVDTSRPTNN